MSSTVFFTGHMIDRPGRLSPRFPPSLAEQVARRIGKELDDVGATDGFSSAACGADILFLEAMLNRGGRINVALPCVVESFRQDCVDIIPGADWGARFDRILRSAESVEILGEQYASDNAMASECCNRVMIGLAKRCATQKGEEILTLALWDGAPGDAAGGTYSAVQFCMQHGYPIRLMSDLSCQAQALTRTLASAPQGTTSAIRHEGWAAEAPQQICAIVFADAVGFSKLREREVPEFARRYLSCAMQAMQAQSLVPLVKNTWGDALYLVFESVREAGLFALDFRDRIMSEDWRRQGFSEPVNVRIGLHAGPLYRIYDPVFGQWSYTGAHVTRAARLEPSVDAGKVFASLAFVALAYAERVIEFTSRSAGRRPLVKNAGEMSVFELHAQPSTPTR